MNSFLKFLLFLTLFLSPVFSIAQDEDEDIDDKPLIDDSPYSKNYYWLSLRAAVTVPHPMANKAFRKSFVGVFNAGADLDILIFKGLYLGASFENAQLKITGNKIANYSASMEVDNAGVKLGSDIFLGEKNRMIISGALVYGQNWTTYYNLIGKTSPPEYTRFICNYAEPSLSFYFLADENVGIGINLSYTFFDHTFDPYELRLNDWAPFDHNSTGTTQYIHFGFGFYYNILKKKNKD